MPAAIADASTLIHLSAIGRLDLLRQFYGKVLVPPAVWREVVEQGEGRPGAAEVAKAREQGWLELVSPSNGELVRLLRDALGAGEAEAIALAAGHSDAILLIDERDGRDVAEALRIRKTGILGVLIKAQREGLIGSLAADLDALQERTAFRISVLLRDRALREGGGETPPSKPR